MTTPSPQPATPSAKDIFADALEVPLPQREVFIKEACRGDQALIAEVLGLIGIHADARQFLSLPTITGHPESAEAPGTMIGNYKLRELIGEGGFGSVFFAEQEQPVRRRVALKIIKLGMDTRSVVARFEQERQALAMMDHPNIAKVLDAGATATGRPYFVMELVKGEPITTYCDKNHLTIDERLDLFTQVCHAVHHAHTKGIVHRDIKPTNILVTTQDGRPLARVIDFGIAKATAHRLTEKTVFTEFRNFIGTPEYMSPEQAEGSLDIDTRTDVYSLGVLLYELLTGTTPFDPKRLRSAAFAELQRIIREVEPPKPSTRLQQSADTLAGVAALRRVEPARLNTQVRGELDWIVMKSLDKDRARRYDSPSALASDIVRHLSGEAVTAAPPTRFYRARKLVARNRGVVLAGSLIALALAAGAIGMGVLAVMESNARSRAERAEAATRERSEDLQRIAEFQSTQLREVRPDVIAEIFRAELLTQTRAAMERAKATPAQIDQDISALKSFLARPNLTNIAVRILDGTIIERSIRAVNDQFANQPLVRARLLQTLSATMLNLGLLDRAAGAQTEALAIRRKELGNEHPDTIESVSGAAELLRQQGRLDQAAPLFTEAFETSRRVLGENHRQTLTALINFSTMKMHEGKLDEAEPLQREAIEMSRRLLGDSHPDLAGAMSNLAFNIVKRNKLDEAVGLVQGALAIRRKALGDDHPDTIESVNNLGFMLRDAARAPEAERLFREAHEARRRILGDEHPQTITALNNIGSALRAQGKALEAEAIFREAWQSRLRSLGPDHPDTISGAANLGVALSDLNRREEAIPLYRAAYDGNLRIFGADDPRTLNSMANLGSILDMLGKFNEAEPFVRSAYEGRLRNLGKDHADTLMSQHNYAYFLHHRGELDRASALCEETLATRRAAIGPKNPRTLTSMHLLGTIRRDQGRLSEAEALLKEALDGRAGHPSASESRYWYARTLLDQQKFEDAEREALTLEKELRGHAPASPGKVNRSVQLLVSVYEALSRFHPDKVTEAERWRGQLQAPTR